MTGSNARRNKQREIWIRDRGRCHYCHELVDWMPDTDMTIDHVVPKAKGGSSSKTNLVLACQPCNNAKGSRTYEEFTGRTWKAS